VERFGGTLVGDHVLDSCQRQHHLHHLRLIHSQLHLFHLQHR
jgi:hypothetical protein